MVQKESINGRLTGLSLWIAACMLVIFALIWAPLASASSHISKTSIGALVGDQPTVLNWKTNDVIIPFDLPDTVWVDRVEVLISARPTGELRHRRNLRLRLNGSKPETLNAQGQRFDARVTLEQRHLRRRGNKLYLSGISTSSSCAGPNHAGWEIDKEKSMVVFYGRNMTRNLTIRDLISMFNQPKSGPSKLGLKVVGEDIFRNEALLTQGITLRTGKLPQLRSAFSGNDIDLVAGIRPDVERYIRRTDSRSGIGPQIILDESRPPRIILTGDNPRDVREAVNAFARHKLPRTRRVEIRPVEMTLQPILANQRINFQKTHKLADAGALRPAEKWVTTPLSFNFDTTYAAQRTGQLILRLNGDKETLSEDSKLSVTLNDKPLGETNIDARRKTIRLDIPNGYLVGANNKLVIDTDLKPNAEISTCDVVRTLPGFSLGLGSKMALSSNVDKTIHDVSNIASPSGPFVQSKNITIVSTSTRQSDRLATLRLMGHMAHISGTAWTQAEYIEPGTPIVADTENVLLVGPRNNNFESFLTHAPKALRLALNGQTIPNIPEKKVASVLRVAGLDSNQAFKLASTSARRQAKRFASGLISVYDDPDKSQTISVITAYPGGSFSTAAGNLIKPQVWNDLSGSVAQWDNVGAHMLQTAQPKLLTSSQPLYAKQVSLNNLLALDWESFGTIHDDMAETLYKTWEKPASAIATAYDNAKTNIQTKWSGLFTGYENETRTLRIDETAPEATAAKTSAASAETRTSLPSLRGASSSDATSTRRVNTLSGSSLSDNLSAGLSHIKLGAASAIGSVKSWANDTYKNFDTWVNTVNRNRQAQGQPPIASSPILAILILICAGLIILGLAKPRQL